MSRSFVLSSFFGLALFAATLSPREAHAQSAAAAEALFTEGKNAMDAKDYQTACQRFGESNRLDPAVGTLLNLAVCESARDHVATAWELFRTVSEKLSADDPRRGYVADQLAKIEPRLPKLVLRLAAGAPANTKAHEGEVEFAGAAFGLPLPMDPGRHVFTVDAPGFEPATFEVDLAEASARELEIAPGAALGTPAAAPQTESAATRSVATGTPASVHDGALNKRTIGFIVGGVGAAGVVVGLSTGIGALNKKSTTKQDCSDALRLCSQDGRDAASAGRTLAAVSTVGWIVGAAGIGVGTYFILTSRPKHGPETAVSANVTPFGAALSLQRTW